MVRMMTRLALALRWSRSAGTGYTVQGSIKCRQRSIISPHSVALGGDAGAVGGLRGDGGAWMGDGGSVSDLGGDDGAASGGDEGTGGCLPSLRTGTVRVTTSRGKGAPDSSDPASSPLPLSSLQTSELQPWGVADVSTGAGLAEARARQARCRGACAGSGDGAGAGDALSKQGGAVKVLASVAGPRLTLLPVRVAAAAQLHKVGPPPTARPPPPCAGASEPSCPLEAADAATNDAPAGSPAAAEMAAIVPLSCD
eukprot:212969-Chlamydomonas_euryale.AAC.1